MEIRESAVIEAKKIVANLTKYSNVPGPGVTLPLFKFYICDIEEFKRWGQYSTPAFPVVIEMPDGRVPTTDFKIELLTAINTELNLLNPQELDDRLNKAKKKEHRYLLFTLLNDLYVSL